MPQSIGLGSNHDMAPAEMERSWIIGGSSCGTRHQGMETMSGTTRGNADYAGMNSPLDVWVKIVY